MIKMDRLAQLELHTERLSTAVKSLMDHRHDIESPEPPRASADTDRELSNVKASILANIAAIKALVGGPDDLLQGLATQVTSPTLSRSPFPICHFRHMSLGVTDSACP